MNAAPYLIHTIAVAAYTGIGSDGDLTYGSPASVKARVEKKQTVVKSPDGQQTVSDHQVLTLTAIGEKDRIWMPGQDSGDATLARTPQSVDQVPSLSGDLILYMVRL